MPVILAAMINIFIAYYNRCRETVMQHKNYSNYLTISGRGLSSMRNHQIRAYTYKPQQLKPKLQMKETEVYILFIFETIKHISQNVKLIFVENLLLVDCRLLLYI